MLRRGALVLFLLIASGIAALFAANQAGITWPWQRETTAETPAAERAPDTASQQREEKTGPESESAAAPAEKSPSSPETARKEAEKAIEQTTAALSPSAAPSEPKPDDDDVDIDISRISADGSSVFAGRAEPNKYVTVLENGKPAGTVRADANGEWSLSTEHKFASTDPKLTYEVSDAPPPAPTPPAPEPKVAEAPAAAPSNSAASDAMKKFEDMVAEAREEAKKEEEAKKQEEQSQSAAAPSQPAEAPKPDTGTKTAEVAPSAPAEATPPEQTPAGKPTVTEQPEPEKPATAEAPRESREAAATSSTAASGASSDRASSDSASSGSTSSGSASSGSSSAAAAKADTTVAAAATAGAAAQKSVSIPVPIMFVYNEANLTPDGERAAKLLLEYLTLKRYSAIELTGHADERGTYEYNMDLSRERLNTVASRLKEGGYSGDLTLVPKGKSEPYTGVDRKRYTGEALFQLDRRVELRVAR